MSKTVKGEWWARCPNLRPDGQHGWCGYATFRTWRQAYTWILMHCTDVH